MRFAFCFRTGLLAGGLALAGLPGAVAADGDITVVASKVSDDYVRTKLPDGTFAAETYVFGEGGLTGGSRQDFTVDQLKFLQIARTVAGPLRSQHYLPSADPATTKLLILVYWGTTTGAAGASSSVAYQNMALAGQRMGSAAAAVNSAARAKATDPEAQASLEAAAGEFDQALTLATMANRQRDRTNWNNAGILGYDADLTAAQGHEGTALDLNRRDLVSELEDDRYFVVLMAYDFRLLATEKKPKLLWETRYSIRQRGNDFGQQLEAMTQAASRYFGQDSHGLRRKPLPQGEVQLGELKVIGVEPGK